MAKPISKVVERAITQNEVLLQMVAETSIQNSALHLILKENGVSGEALQERLDQKTSDPAIRNEVYTALSEIAEGMTNALNQAVNEEALEAYSPSAASTLKH